MVGRPGIAFGQWGVCEAGVRVVDGRVAAIAASAPALGRQVCEGPRSVCSRPASAPAPAQHREVHESCGTPAGSRGTGGAGCRLRRAPTSGSVRQGTRACCARLCGHRVPPAPRQSEAAMFGGLADIASFLRPASGGGGAPSASTGPSHLCDGLRGTCGEGGETRAPAEVLVCHSALQWVPGGLRYGCVGQGISRG
jgi:hypothetical protein